MDDPAVAHLDIDEFHRSLAGGRAGSCAPEQLGETSAIHHRVSARETERLPLGKQASSASCKFGRSATPNLDAADRRLEALPPREREVLELITRGSSNSEIAEALVIEESTVKAHVKRVLMKLGLRDRIHAVIFGYESGLTQPGSKPTT